MHQDWIQRIDQNTALYKEYFNSLSWKELNQKADKESWSIGQIIDHVNKLNQDYFKVFDQLIAGELKAPFIMKSRFLSTYLGNLLLDSIEPERKKKTKTMTIWEPDETISNDVLSKFEENQNTFKEFISILHPQILNNLIIHSPLSKWITLPLSTAIEALIQHELRHFNQAKELLGKQQNLNQLA